MSRINSFRESGARYPILRFVGAICTGLGFLLMVLGVLLIAVGLIGVTTDLVKPINGVGAGIGLIWSIGCFASGLQLLVIGAFIKLAIHVEENTRATAQALDKLRLAMEPKVDLGAHSNFLS